VILLYLHQEWDTGSPRRTRCTNPLPWRRHRRSGKSGCFCLPVRSQELFCRYQVYLTRQTPNKNTQRGRSRVQHVRDREADIEFWVWLFLWGNDRGVKGAEWVGCAVRVSFSQRCPRPRGGHRKGEKLAPGAFAMLERQGPQGQADEPISLRLIKNAKKRRRHAVGCFKGNR